MLKRQTFDKNLQVPKITVVNFLTVVSIFWLIQGHPLDCPPKHPCLVNLYRKTTSPTGTCFASKPGMKTCESCGKEFKPTGYNQKYCSIKCQRKAADRRKTERKRAIPKIPQPCAYCNETFTPKSYKVKYCSEECARRAMYKRQTESRKGLFSKGGVITTLVKCPSCGGTRLEEGRYDRAARSFCFPCRELIEKLYRCAEGMWSESPPITGKIVLPSGLNVFAPGTGNAKSAEVITDCKPTTSDQ